MISISWMRTVILFPLLLLCSCESFNSVPAGRIRIKNDSQDREYNILLISGGGVSFGLKPGQDKLLPGGTTNISFRREYKDHVRTYEVSCPEGLESGITIKLIDVHTNRIAGGCKTVGANKF